MLGNSDEIRTKTEDEQNSECCYGGFGGRFLYERWQKNGGKPRGETGRNIAVTLLLCVSVAIVCVLSGVVSYHIVVHNKDIYYPGMVPVTSARESSLTAVSPMSYVSAAVTESDGAEWISVNSDMSVRYCVPMGVLIRDISEDSPGYSMGMRNGDIIVAVDGVPVCGVDDLSAVISSRDAVARSEIQIFRDGGMIVIECIF